MKKKIAKLQIFRIVVQIACLILYPGLFILAFGQLGNIYTMVLKGKFNFLQAFPAITAAITLIILTIILGRFFCGWICAFGTFNDLLYLVSKNIFKTKFKVDEKTDSVLKYVKYLVLIFIIVVMWTAGSRLFSSSSPWDAFAELGQFPQVLTDYALGCLILALIAVGAMFIERFFCRYLCPLGAVFSIVSKLRIFKISKPNDKCGKCRLCTNNCAMGIPIYKMNKVNSGECINCLKCIETCPRKNTQATILDEEVNPALVSSVAIVAMAGLYSVNNLVGTAINNNISLGSSSITASTSTSPQVKLKDGTYTGTGSGFRGGTTKVQVTVKNGKISDIQTISTEDTPQFYQNASGTITSEILSAQSASVDTVSGATFSSRGIISAVEDALTQAQAGAAASTSTTSSSSSNTVPNSDTLTDSTAADNSSTNSANTASDNSSTTQNTDTSTSSSVPNQIKYKDGTYTGTGSGFRGGTTKIQITVKNGKISDIQTISTQDTPDFYQNASSLIPNEIISAQSTSVDTVSGATFSSRGIISAVEDALSQAKL